MRVRVGEGDLHVLPAPRVCVCYIHPLSPLRLLYARANVCTVINVSPQGHGFLCSFLLDKRSFGRIDIVLTFGISIYVQVFMISSYYNYIES